MTKILDQLLQIIVVQASKHVDLRKHYYGHITNMTTQSLRIMITYIYIVYLSSSGGVTPVLEKIRENLFSSQAMHLFRFRLRVALVKTKQAK
jgi:hypothetical protein